MPLTRKMSRHLTDLASIIAIYNLNRLKVRNILNLKIQFSQNCKMDLKGFTHGKIYFFVYSRNRKKPNHRTRLQIFYT